MTKYIEKEQEHKNRNGVPFLLEGIGTRISEVCYKIGTRKKAANIAEVSTDTLQRYISEEVKPSFEPVARLCLEVGASLEWMATGKGGMGSNMVAEDAAPYHSSIALNAELLAEVIEVVENELGKRRAVMKSDKKSELIAIVYEEFSQPDAEPDTSKIVRLINLAS